MSIIFYIDIFELKSVFADLNGAICLLNTNFFVTVACLLKGARWSEFQKRLELRQLRSHAFGKTGENITVEPRKFGREWCLLFRTVSGGRWRLQALWLCKNGTNLKWRFVNIIYELCSLLVVFVMWWGPMSGQKYCISYFYYQLILLIWLFILRHWIFLTFVRAMLVCITLSWPAHKLTV